MNFVTTKIVLTPHMAFNSMANSCLTFARDLLGGREVTVMNNNITAREFKASSHPFYITALKVVSCTILILLGVVFRLLSCYNPDVRRALSYTPASKSSQEQESTQNSDKKVETPKMATSPKKEHTPTYTPAPKSSQEQESTQNSKKEVETPKMAPSLKKGYIPLPEKKNEVSDWVMNINKPSSKELLSLIDKGKCNLLHTFKNCEIEIVDDSDVITLAKLSLLKSASFLAEKLINDQTYSSRIALSDINDDFLDVAKKAKHSKICSWILDKRPLLTLTVRSGLPYLELISNSQDPQILEFLKNPFKDESLSKSAAFYLDQLYIHIPHALLLSEVELTKELKFYHCHLGQFLNISQKADFLKAWINKEKLVLPVFEELKKKTIGRPDVKTICSIQGDLLKYAFVYLGYLELDTNGNKSESSKKLLEMYGGVLKQLEWAKVNVPTCVGKELFKKYVFPQLKTAISNCS